MIFDLLIGTVGAALCVLPLAIWGVWYVKREVRK